jgi:peptide/nickel transport system substrate-binding protein
VYTGQYDICIGTTEAQPTPFITYRGLMSTFSYRPVGQSASENWHRYKNTNADALLGEWAKTTDTGRQKELCRQLQKIFVDNLPVIPLYWQPEWGAYNTTRVTGFPDQNNAYAPLTNVGTIPTHYIVLTTVQPVSSA